MRSAIQRTGRPVRRAAHVTSAYSGCEPSFRPKPPPTSGDTTRISWSGTATPSDPHDDHYIAGDRAFVKYLAWLSSIALLIVTALPAPANSQIAGFWLTDGRDGVVEIRPCGGGLFCGHIRSILNDYGKGPNVQDILNEKPELRSRPICGLPVLGKLQEISFGTWGNGWVYDPKRGKAYDVDVTFSQPDALSVRGYVGVRALGQTVVWTRASSNAPKCK